MSPLRPIARRALAAQSDERLVRLLREGHEPAFEEIVRRYRPSLVAFATAIVSHSRAEDVVQTSLAKAHRALLADSREVALKPWLFTIVRNGALNTIRAEPLAEELITATSMVPGPSELAEQREDLDRLVEAICALPTAQRDALVKRELEGEGHGEIAAQLGTSATAVRGLIFRARTTLRDALGAFVPLPLLRMLLAEGPAVAGGAAASGGVSAAVLGGAGAKGGTVIAAAIVALGTGMAVERNHRGEQRPVGGEDAAIVRSADAAEEAASDPVPGTGVVSGSDDAGSAPADEDPLTIEGGDSGRTGADASGDEGSGRNGSGSGSGSGSGGAAGDSSGTGGGGAPDGDPGGTPGSGVPGGGADSGQGGPGSGGGGSGDPGGGSPSAGPGSGGPGGTGSAPGSGGSGGGGGTGGTGGASGSGGSGGSGGISGSAGPGSPGASGSGPDGGGSGSQAPPPTGPSGGSGSDGDELPARP